MLDKGGDRATSASTCSGGIEDNNPVGGCFLSMKDIDSHVREIVMDLMITELNNEGKMKNLQSN